MRPTKEWTTSSIELVPSRADKKENQHKTHRRPHLTGLEALCHVLLGACKDEARSMAGNLTIQSNRSADLECRNFWISYTFPKPLTNSKLPFQAGSHKVKTTLSLSPSPSLTLKEIIWGFVLVTPQGKPKAGLKVSSDAKLNCQKREARSLNLCRKPLEIQSRIVQNPTRPATIEIFARGWASRLSLTHNYKCHRHTWN